ncbi:MAG: PIG-L family deacetylase [Planctomycetes bacterium]|nr:PIG-L family deacetylase [Planctomycetota bacterium]
MNVVSVMAHQDDEMRCLGTMLRCRDRGDRLHFICLTDGSKGLVDRPDTGREEAAAVRRAEMSDLCGALGASYRCLGEPDEYLADTPAVRDALIDAIREAGAELVFTHYHEDYNADHVLTHHLVHHCAMQSCLPVIGRRAPLASHPAVFCVEPHGTSLFAPSHFVDVTAVEEEKVALLCRHRSQEIAMRRAVSAGFDDLCRVPDAYWGQKVGCRYAEPFVPMSGRGGTKPFAVLP